MPPRERKPTRPDKGPPPEKKGKVITNKTHKPSSVQLELARQKIKQDINQNMNVTPKINNMKQKIKQNSQQNIKPKNKAKKTDKKTGLTYLVKMSALPNGKTHLELVTSSLNPNELGVDGQIAFQGGFMVDGDQTPISPYTWGGAPVAANSEATIRTRSYAPPWPLVFSSVADPSDANAPLKNKIAIVRDKRSEDGEPVNAEYSYNLFTYMDASQKSSLKYVSSGSSQSVSPNGHLISNTFIPLDILNTRLCGDWQARQQAYTRDWLAFCFYIVDVEANKPHNQRRSTKDLLPNELLKLFEKDQDAAGLANILRPDWNGAHLGARNSVGEFSTIGAKFLYELLFDKDLKLMSASSLARHIFKRWCLVAHSAASLAKEPFSVKARFWKIPRLPNVNNSLELVYVLLPEFWSWTETVDHGIMEDQTISADLKTTIRRISRDDEYRRQADELWGDFMTRAFAKAASNTAQPITARLALPTDNVQNMVLLGSHPQGYYSTYIQPQDLELLRSHGYTWGGDHHPFPRHMQPHEIVSLSESTTLSVTGVYECKTTVISKMNIQNASNWPRIRTQNAVMDNISANQVAMKIWDKKILSPAEWLHRAAYSFGGSGDPDSAQEQTNLVFGTFEANTEMIRFESYLKRIADGTFKTELPVVLETWLNEEGSKLGNGQSLPWLAPNLFYQWSFVFNQNYGKVIRVKNFDLFSRNHPMLYEVEVDEIFDTNLAATAEVVKAVADLFLFSQSELGVAYTPIQSKL